MPTMKDIERHKLSDGTIAVVSKFGRKYVFAHCDPHMTYSDTGFVERLPDISKAEAMDKLADVLKADVLEHE